MALHFASDADRRPHGPSLAAQPDVVRFLADLTVSVFVAGVLCATFAWLDRPSDAAPRPAPVVELSPAVAEAGQPWAARLPAMSELMVRGATALVDGEWVQTDVAARDGVLIAVTEVGAGADEIAGDGLLVAPGYVDLQCNGGVGIDLASEPERLWELGAELPRFGVTAWLPTIVSTPDGIVDRAIAALAGGPPDGWRGAVPVGLHLEGPFLSPAKRGAHPEPLLRPPTLDAIEGWSRAAGVALVTIAPDLPGALEVIAELVGAGRRGLARPHAGHRRRGHGCRRRRRQLGHAPVQRDGPAAPPRAGAGRRGAGRRAPPRRPHPRRRPRAPAGGGDRAAGRSASGSRS